MESQVSGGLPGGQALWLQQTCVMQHYPYFTRTPWTLSSEMGQADKQRTLVEKQAWKGPLAAFRGKHMMFLGLHRAAQLPSSELALTFTPQDRP